MVSEHGGGRTSLRLKAGATALLLTLPLPAHAQSAEAVRFRPGEAHVRSLAAGYKALFLCAGVFTAGRQERAIEALELRGIYPEYDRIVPTLAATVDRRTATVAVAFDPRLPARRATWARGRGCTLAPAGSPPPAIAQTYARPPGPAGADPRPWPLGDTGVAPADGALARVAERAFTADYGRGTETVSVVVLHNGRVVAERYREGFGPFTANRTWSVAKSIAGTLVGYAGVPAAAPADVPEWRSPAGPDPRARITYAQLLRMSSGLHSDTAGNRTDAIYFGGTTVTEQALGWPLEAPPGARFRYANNDILLATRGLRARLGEAGYRALPGRLFGALGMTHSVAEADWRGNYILSSAVWTTARDLARLGQFWLQDGVWQGKRLLPAGWVRFMTTPAGPQPERAEGYGASLWLFGEKQGLPAGTYSAQGSRGQYVMVVPSHRLVVVRRGEDPVDATFDIARFTADVVKAR